MAGRAAAAAGSKPLTYFSAWFCPFAHRATIALEHHRDAVPYTWVEALGWEQKPATGQENHAASDRADWWYHYKHPDLLAANPLGMVPTLVDGGRGAKGVVTESAVCIEFIDEMASANGGSAPPLLPSCPFERAHARLAADGVNKQVCSAYYQVLVRTEDAERRAGFAKLVDGLRNFTAGMQGDYYCGDTLSLVDCMLLPYAYRLYVLEHYRGTDFAVPRSGEDGLWGKYHAWLDRATSLEYVRPTLPDQARYLKHVEKYAEGKARSKVGNAVRRGVSAHEYDDSVDDDEVPQK